MTSLRDTNLVYDTSKGEHAVHGTWLSVDVVAFTADVPESRILLIKRGIAPHKGETTLPGGLLAAWNGETVEDAARRILREKANVEQVERVVPVTVVSDPGRDERGHTVSIVVATTVPASTQGAVMSSGIPDDMPFGHSKMVQGVLDKLAVRLLVDPETTYGLIGNVVTAPQVTSILTACGVSASAARSRLERSPLYRPMEHTFAVPREQGGRPPRIFAKV